MNRKSLLFKDYFEIFPFGESQTARKPAVSLLGSEQLL